MNFKDHFSTQAAVYAKARPTYPAALFSELGRLAPRQDLAWDCGAGNGQASVALAEVFARVVATEPSATQLAEAMAHPRVTYVQVAERVPSLPDQTVDLVTAAQAAHWFDLKAFYPEVRRVLRPGGVVALWTYGICRIGPELDGVVEQFYNGTIGPYWPPERHHCETGYRELEFPFQELPFPKLNLEVVWTAGEFIAYLRSWSAVARYRQANGHDPVALVEGEIARLWGAERRMVVWPLGGRLGRLETGAP